MRGGRWGPGREPWQGAGQSPTKKILRFFFVFWQMCSRRALRGRFGRGSSLSHFPRPGLPSAPRDRLRTSEHANVDQLYVNSLVAPLSKKARKKMRGTVA